MIPSRAQQEAMGEPNSPTMQLDQMPSHPQSSKHKAHKAGGACCRASHVMNFNQVAIKYSPNLKSSVRRLGRTNTRCE